MKNEETHPFPQAFASGKRAERTEGWCEITEHRTGVKQGVI